MHIKSNTNNSLVLSVLAVLLVGCLIGNGFALMSQVPKPITLQG